MNTRAVRGWHQMFTNQGFAATFRVATERVAQRLRPQPEIGNRLHASAETAKDGPLALHPFDDCYGVDTSGLIWGEHLTSGSRNDRWSTAYYGIAPSIFNAVLAELRDSIPGAAFVDMGSGKGRAVMLASQLPFAEVVGVELSPALHEIAMTNFETFRRKAAVSTKVDLQCKDAAEFEFPSQPLILFFYHPFCKPVLKTVLRRLEQSLRANPRPAHVVYINTELREVLDGTPYLTQTFSQTLAMSNEDQMADRIGSTVEECAIYKSAIH
jgi:hypothetical protein